MIPYFNGHLFDIGSVPIHLFGVLVAIGVIVGDRIVVAEGKKRGLEEQDVPPHGGKLARAVEARDATADDNNIGAPRRGQASSLGGPGKANNSSPPANRIPRIQ